MNPAVVYRVAVAVSGLLVLLAGTAITEWWINRNRNREIPQGVNYPPPAGNQNDWEPPEDSPSDLCGVCLEELGGSRFHLPCRHQLHFECARALYEHNVDSSCPICRRKVTREDLRLRGMASEMKKEL